MIVSRYIISNLFAKPPLFHNKSWLIQRLPSIIGKWIITCRGFYKIIFSFYTNSGEYLATYGRRNTHGSPPRDLAATNIVINYPLEARKDEQS